MYHQEILTPLKMYRSFLRNEHAGNSVEAFDELFRRSGVDPAANAALVKVIRKLEKEIARVKARLSGWKVFRAGMILVAAAGVVGFAMWLLQLSGQSEFGIPVPVGIGGGVVAILATVLIFTVLNKKIGLFEALVADREREVQARRGEAWAAMAPLNQLYQWDTMASIVMKTMPILVIDRYVSEARILQLYESFGWMPGRDNTISTLTCQSGTVNGNPWVITEELHQQWDVKTYTGTLLISWQEWERYTDPRGKSRSRLVTKTELLTAAVEKPIPVYRKSKRLIYGNEGAPDLNFSREPNPLSRADAGFWGRRRLKKAIAELEEKSRDADNTFTIVDNREFDACFNAVDRDHEVQFRLLFTPLAQQEMLKLLRDQKTGYGDDFHFRKRGMVNILHSEHLDRMDISAAPGLFQNYDLGAARKEFIAYSNEFFRCLFFSFAPLFCIPLYQQHRNFQDIYQGVIDSGEASSFEYEALSNTIGESRFRPAGAATRSILKTGIAARSGEDVVLTVSAYAFRQEERVEYVARYGGDGRWHNVPVHWVEYLPVSRETSLAVCHAGTGDSLEFAEQLLSPEWKERLRVLGGDRSTPYFRRGLAAFDRL